MSTLRISNIEAKSVPASATIDEKVKITNSSGDVLVFLDGKTSGITTVGINTTDGNITFDANSNVVVTGIITATKFVGTIEPTNLNISGDLSIADKIIHSGDTNTAIRFPAADAISFETNGAERLRIQSNGLIGIGTATVRNSRAVQITGASSSILLITGNAPSICLNADADDSSDNDRTFLGQAIGSNNFANGTAAGDTVLRGNSSGRIVFGIGTNVKMILTSAGDLNIGSVGRFDASGLVKSANGTASAPSHTFLNDPDNGMYRSSTNQISFATGGLERLRIGSSGETTLTRLNTFPNPNNTGSEILGGKLVFGSNISLEERYPNGAYVDRQDLVLRTNTGYGQGLSDKIRFTAGGTINFETSGGGLHFGSMSNASGMTSETLDDYEEGSFTPFIRTVNNTTEPSYTHRVGLYTKVGRLVTYAIRITTSGELSTGSGATQIHGLPFNAMNWNIGDWPGGAEIAYYSNLRGNYGTNPRLLGPYNNNTYIRFHLHNAQNDTGNNLYNHVFTNNTVMIIYGQYFAA